MEWILKKSENKDATNDYKYFFESNFAGVNGLLALIYPNKVLFTKKGINKNYNIIINGKNFYDRLVDIDIKRDKEIKKLAAAQDENCTTGCFLDYEYIKNHYKLTAIDLRRQKEFEADPKAIKQIDGEL